MPDPESITPLLAERLDISPDRAETLLQSMLQELKSQAAAENVLLSELGTFEKEDGTLTFNPSPSLQRRVNHQFEGLSPEDLSGPPSARPEAEAPPSPEESSREDPETAPAIDPSEEDEDSGDEADRLPLADPHGPKEAEEAPPDEDEEKPASPTRTFPVISGLLLFTVLLGIGWFILTETNLWSSSQLPSATSEPETAQPADPEKSSQSADPEMADDPSEDGDQPDRDTDARPEDASDEDAGSDAVDAEAGTWTVVIASRSSRPEAEAVASEYNDQLDTVRVVRSTVNDKTWYRVMAGQYDSEAAAKRALDANASIMPSDAWLHDLP